VLTFVEVKTRSGTVKGRPADAVNAEKRRLIQRGAQDWLRRLGHPPISIRFDIVEVVLAVGMPPHVNVIEDAFQLPASSMEGRTK
jgi:putative endonuclease